MQELHKKGLWEERSFHALSEYTFSQHLHVLTISEGL